MKFSVHKALDILAAAVFAGSVVLAAGLASAHDYWLMVDEAAAGKAVKLTAGYGHAFPAGEKLGADLFSETYIAAPSGKVACKPTGGMGFTCQKALPQGSYIAVGGRKLRWYTKSPEGTQYKPKNQVPDAGRCVRSVKYAKAVVNVGKAAGNVSAPVGLPLEIAPLTNPALLKAGDALEVQVLYQGKPLAKANVWGTFAGFTKEPNAYAFAGRTDKEGKVKVVMLKGGLWLLKATHKKPFIDPAVCDELSESSTLTYVVK